MLEGVNAMEKQLLDKIIDQKQIYTVFQPIVSLKIDSPGEVLGYEALSRFSDEDNYYAPLEIYKHARKHDRVWDLELICRTSALETANENKIMVPPYNKKLFLNVSPKLMDDQVHETSFTKEFLKENQISSKQLVFEITERTDIRDFSSFNKTIQSFKEEDYLIAIDDAGAGYSGLNLISEVNPNYIKLDMKLIENIDTDPIKAALIKGMMEFSNLSNVELIAEGIETREQLEMLIHLGVQYGQGYFIQKPNSYFFDVPKKIEKIIRSTHQQINQMNQIGTYHSSIRQLTEDTLTIHPSQTVDLAYDHLNHYSESFGLCVVEDGIPIGILTKEKLALKLSGRYGYTLHQNKPVSTIMDTDFLSVDCNTPVNIVSSKAMRRHRENVYDFIVVTDKGKYQGIVTIKKILEKSNQLEILTAKEQNPLTGLPGNSLIHQKISAYIDQKSPFTVAYLDIDNFKAYNDYYGFEYGDAIIKLLAEHLLEEIPHNQFIGHIGGDDFVVVLDGYFTDQYFDHLLERFEKSIIEFYKEEDIKRGYITTTNRYGEIENTPLITLTAVSMNNQFVSFKNIREITETLAHLKTQVKRDKCTEIDPNK